MQYSKNVSILLVFVFKLTKNGNAAISGKSRFDQNDKREHHGKIKVDHHEDDHDQEESQRTPTICKQKCGRLILTLVQMKSTHYHTCYGETKVND